MPLTIDLAVEHDAWVTHWAGLDELEALLGRSLAAAADRARAHRAVAVPEHAEISLVLCDDSFIRALNRRWRGLDKPTNVLSFPAAAAARAVTLGDIVVAYETTRGEAEGRGMPLADHLAHLVVHGFFHLLGFDHEEAAEAERMEALEIGTLAALGIASPFEALEDAADLRATP